MSGTSPGTSALHVTSDLSIEIDGTSAHLSSDGTRLVLSSTRPEKIWAAAVGAALPVGVGQTSGPRAVGRLADELAAVGLSLEVTGPAGRVVRLGDGVQSRVGRATTGSAAVGPGRPGALAVVLWHGQRRLVGGVAALLAGGVVAAIWARARRR